MSKHLLDVWAVLSANPGVVLSRARLQEAMRSQSTNYRHQALASCVSLIRRHLVPNGYRVRNVVGQGYIYEPIPAPTKGATDGTHAPQEV